MPSRDDRDSGGEQPADFAEESSFNLHAYAIHLRYLSYTHVPLRVEGVAEASGGMNEFGGNIADALHRNAGLLFARKGVCGIEQFEARAAADDLGPHAQGEVQGVAVERDGTVEPTAKGRLGFTAGDFPHVVGANEIFFADTRPDSPDKGLLHFGDGYGNAATEIEVAAIDDALIEIEEDAEVEFGLRDRGDGVWHFDAVADGEIFVPFIADAAGEAGLGRFFADERGVRRGGHGGGASIFAGRMNGEREIGAASIFYRSVLPLHVGISLTLNIGNDVTLRY